MSDIEHNRLESSASARRSHKLRDSCKDCASSKVRCSKEKPTCSRCARRGLSCTYMVSRRTGRNAANASKQGLHFGVRASSPARAQPASDKDPVLPEPIDEGADRLSAIDSIKHPDTRRSSLDSGIGLASTVPSMTENYGAPSRCINQEPQTTDWSSITFPRELDNGPASLFPVATAMREDYGDFIDLHLDSALMEPKIKLQRSDFFSDTTAPSPVPNTFTSMADVHYGSNAPSLSRNASSSASAVAADSLRHLLSDTPSQSTSEAPYPFQQTLPTCPEACAIASVLAEDKDITGTLASVPDCCCSRDEYLVSIIALATLKMMDQYYATAAAARADDPAPSSSSPAPASLCPATPAFADSAAPPASRRPFTSSFGSAERVGGCPAGHQHCGTWGLATDPLAEAAVQQSGYRGPAAAQLVLGDLYRVQRVVSSLLTKLEGIRLRADGAATVLSGTTLLHLEEDLRMKLRELSGVIVDALRRA